MADLPGCEALRTSHEQHAQVRRVPDLGRAADLERHTLLEGVLATRVNRLKGEHHGGLIVTGARELARNLMAEGLVDEIRIAVSPYL
jgi:dihydrofolate reductase